MSGDDTLTELLTEAVAHSRHHVENGGLPFVGVVVGPDGLVSPPGFNQVRETGDPTAHAETVAIRAVAARHGPSALIGATLLATGEPCSLCYRFAADHGIERVIYAVDQDTAATWGFDYRTRVGRLTPAERALVGGAEHRPVPGRLDPFATYLRMRGLPSPDTAPSALSKDS
ncbi:nucleoside deaminase [Streptomyces sp. 891-h]|uniref:nucleoside deaminase n=1 Tax=Streptomyces sp. 891-h TaxID=2720714 RepID=UPI001FAA2D9E|nr:nucleoside deaminase [Streptomyces sp. 891-h]UNZ19828.1 nucleoside deaminase [Streptomyces sp. 891-h]